MPVRLIDTRPVVYTVPGQTRIRRQCRTWITANGRILCVVTEMPADTGMSITNAAEEVRAALEATWGAGCRIIEHYPWPDGEHYDEQVRPPAGSIRWHRLDADRLRAELGPELDEISPANPLATANAGPAACFCCQNAAHTSCRICQRDLCRDCSTDHHHEGYGTPATVQP